MDIDQANIENLTSLWKRYGAEAICTDKGSTLFANRSWPFRCWLEGKSNLDLQTRATPESHRLSTWVFGSYDDNGEEQHIANTCRERGWILEFEQTAMYLPLIGYKAPDPQAHQGLVFKAVSDQQQLRAWLSICSEAFGYVVDEKIIKSVWKDKDLSLLLGMVDGEPALTALIFTTGDVVGLHQLGVKTRFQGQGLSKIAMHQLLQQASEQGSKYMVLQASAAGLPLYRKLGFHLQFSLKHFKAAVPLP